MIALRLRRRLRQSRPGSPRPPAAMPQALATAYVIFDEDDQPGATGFVAILLRIDILTHGPARRRPIDDGKGDGEPRSLAGFGLDFDSM